MVSSTPRPQFTPGKDPVPILQEAGWAPGPVWTGGKSRPHRYLIPDLPARSQSPYRLSYPVHTTTTTTNTTTTTTRVSDPVTGPVWSRGWVEVYLYSSMTAALEGGEWSAARPGRTLPRERPCTHFTERWVGPRAGLDGRKISSPQEFDPGPSSP